MLHLLRRPSFEGVFAEAISYSKLGGDFVIFRFFELIGENFDDARLGTLFLVRTLSPK
ncbi:hypothetical protein ACFPES_31125 [Paenibacillus sp. GCM10023248]|uniref:hypothetical protein n=1 Tax=unclassified Paenibacillus TaxID=185978 RepID=UPI00237911A8|nr:hypothetical protein [Paenibacillus sp. MAHUQ-63]MDD9271496.1 hypothetical protein [Paenibacillus sp. MAHUQ-63]